MEELLIQWNGCTSCSAALLPRHDLPSDASLSFNPEEKPDQPGFDRDKTDDAYYEELLAKNEELIREEDDSLYLSDSTEESDSLTPEEAETPTVDITLSAAGLFSPELPDGNREVYSGILDRITQFGTTQSTLQSGNIPGDDDDVDNDIEPTEPTPDMNIDWESIKNQLKSMIQASIKKDKDTNFALIKQQLLSSVVAPLISHRAQLPPGASVDALIHDIIESPYIESFMKDFILAVSKQSEHLVVSRQVPGAKRALMTFLREHPTCYPSRAFLGNLLAMLAYRQRLACENVPEITAEILKRFIFDRLTWPEVSDLKQIEPHLGEETQTALSDWMPYLDIPLENVPDGTPREGLKLPFSDIVHRLPAGTYIYVDYHIALQVEIEENKSRTYYTYLTPESFYLKTRSSDAAEAFLKTYISTFGQEEAAFKVSYFNNTPDLHVKVFGELPSIPEAEEMKEQEPEVMEGQEEPEIIVEEEK